MSQQSAGKKNSSLTVLGLGLIAAGVMLVFVSITNRLPESEQLVSHESSADSPAKNPNFSARVQGPNATARRPSSSGVTAGSSSLLGGNLENAANGKSRNERVFAAIATAEKIHGLLPFDQSGGKVRLSGRQVSDLPKDVVLARMNKPELSAYQLVTNYKARFAQGSANANSIVQFVPESETQPKDYSIVIDESKNLLGFWNGVVIDLDSKKVTRLPAGGTSEGLGQLSKNQVPQIVFAPKVIK